MEEVDQKMVADEAAQSSATGTDAPETALENALASDAPTDDDVAADAQTWYFMKIFLFLFLDAHFVLGLL